MFTDAVYFFASAPALGTASYVVEFDESGANSTSTVAPTVVVGAPAVSAIGKNALVSKMEYMLPNPFGGGRIAFKKLPSPSGGRCPFFQKESQLPGFVE